MGERKTNERTLQRSFQKFRDGDEALENDEGRGLKTAINNNRLKALVEVNLRTTVQEPAGDLGVKIGTILKDLKEVGRSKKLEKWIPHYLNEN